jgi:hypothetical protein
MDTYFWGLLGVDGCIQMFGGVMTVPIEHLNQPSTPKSPQKYVAMFPHTPPVTIEHLLLSLSSETLTGSV